MRIKEIFEAKYSGHGQGEWAEVLEWVSWRPNKLQEFVKDNQKILKEIFTLMKSSFRMFHDMTLDYIEDVPEEYDDQDRDPEKIAQYWWDMFPQDMDEEPLWQQASSKFGGPEYGDVITLFGHYITENAKRIANYDNVFEAPRYVQLNVDSDLPSYHKWSDAPLSRRVLRDPKVKHKGTGAFASTYQHQDRPHDVTKITKPMDFPDGYQKYLKMLWRHEDRDNPYFPKIRDIKERRKGETNVIAIRMESLRPMYELSRKEAETVLSKWLGNNKDHILKKNGYYNGGIPELISDDGYGAVVVKVLRSLASNYEGEIKDVNLRNALMWIKYKVATGGVDLDLGDNNVMFRRSPYGPQVVFTDPVA